MTIKPGLYLIENHSGDFYGGSSVNMSMRWSNHKQSVRLGSKKCPHLYSSMRKYGTEKFTIKPLIICSKESLELYEQKWLDKYYGTDGCLNCSPNAVAPWRGRKMSAAAKKKLSMSKMGSIPWNKGIKRTAAEKQHISEATKLAMSKLDNSCSEETKIKLSMVLTGKIRTTETKRKMSIAKRGIVPWNVGIPHSAATKLKIGNKAKDRHIPQKLSEGDVKNIRALYAAGSQSYNKLATLFGCSKRNIACIITGITWKHIIAGAIQ